MLARIQFAANITFHILFPTITIAMCWCLLFFKVRYNRTKNEAWMEIYRFWVKIFALCFALGVVTGITMSFQFGTNWPGFMATVGNIAGPLLAYEVLVAFFMEATFLGVMLFGMKRVSNRIHTLATALVAIGTTLSAFWIIVLDSWMQTPVGFEMIDGVAHATSWFEIIFNPSMPYRLSHMLIASFLTSAFLIAGISAYRIIRGDNSQSAKIALKFGVYLALIAIPVQIFIGDMHGLNTLHHQPAKVAAMEGIWETEKGADLRLFALVSDKDQRNYMEIKVPNVASLILTHKADGEIQGVNAFENHPPVAPLFYAFRIMVGVGFAMLFASLIATIQLRKGGNVSKPMLWILLIMTFSGWVATIAGWYVTEIGRQPYLVYGVLKTVDAVAQNITSSMIGTTLAMYLTLYAVLFVAFISVVFYMARREVEGKTVTNKHDL